jgi:hypothetical protein
MEWMILTIGRTVGFAEPDAGAAGAAPAYLLAPVHGSMYCPCDEAAAGAALLRYLEAPAGYSQTRRVDSAEKGPTGIRVHIFLVTLTKIHSSCILLDELCNLVKV